jgi:hypothetical protein
VDIIASGPHNGGGLDMTILNGLQPDLSPAMAASLRGMPCYSCRRGLGASVPAEGEGSVFGVLWLFAIFGGVGYFALKADEKKRRRRRR